MNENLFVNELTNCFGLVVCLSACNKILPVVVTRRGVC